MKRIFVLIGIINQLTTTRLNRVLRGQDLPMAQFSLLTHYSHHPERGWTVSELARVMEVNQPAMTKTTQRLLKKEFLSVQVDEKDKRIKRFYITELGLETLNEAWKDLGPEIESIMTSWDEKDITVLRDKLETLKDQLDELRD